MNNSGSGSVATDSKGIAQLQCTAMDKNMRLDRPYVLLATVVGGAGAGAGAGQMTAQSRPITMWYAGMGVGPGVGAARSTMPSTRRLGVCATS